jgi:hypothetical protein
LGLLLRLHASLSLLSLPLSPFSLPLACLLRVKDGKMKACGRMLMWMRKRSKRTILSLAKVPATVEVLEKVGCCGILLPDMFLLGKWQGQGIIKIREYKASKSRVQA